MKNEDKWIQDIRNRMEDYSEPLPAGMWEQLESELDTPKVIPMWRKWQAAAGAGRFFIDSMVLVFSGS